MFDLIDMDLGSVTSGVGRWQSEKDITSAPAVTLFTLNLGFPLLPSNPSIVDPLDLTPFLSLAKSSL